MEKTIVKTILIFVFAVMYFLLFNFIWNHFLRVESSLFVLIGSVVVIFLSLILSILTTDKIVDVIRSS